MPLTEDHVHSYVRMRGENENNIYKCNDPHCNYFAPANIIEGKAALCMTCRKEFVISREQLRKKRRELKCANCKSRKTFGGHVVKPDIQLPTLDPKELANALRKIL